MALLVMRPRSSRAVQRLMHVYLHAQIPVDAGDMRTWRTTVIWLREKPEDPKFEPHAGIKMAQVLGSPMHICDTDLIKVYSKIKFIYSIS